MKHLVDTSALPLTEYLEDGHILYIDDRSSEALPRTDES